MPSPPSLSPSAPSKILRSEESVSEKETPPDNFLSANEDSSLSVPSNPLYDDGSSSDSDLADATESSEENDEPDVFEDVHDLNDQQVEEDEKTEEMTPFEISENFRNLKINIMMIKGKLKEVDEGKSSDNSSSISTQIEKIVTQLDELKLSSSRNLEKLKSEIDSNGSIEHITPLKEQLVKLEERFEDSLSNSAIKSNSDSINVLESKVSTLENEKDEDGEISSVANNVEEIFAKIEDLSAEKSDLKSKIVNLESNLSKLSKIVSNDDSLPHDLEPPPPPPLIQNDGLSSSEIENRLHDVEETIDDITHVVEGLTNEVHEIEEKIKDKYSASIDLQKQSISSTQTLMGGTGEQSEDNKHPNDNSIIQEQSKSERTDEIISQPSIKLDDNTKTSLKKFNNLKSFL